MAIVIYAVLGAVGAVGMFLVFRNYHRQKDFESSGHVVPEEYD